MGGAAQRAGGRAEGFGLGFGRQAVQGFGQAEDALGEAERAGGAGLGPLHVAFRRVVGQDEPARGVGAVAGDDGAGVDGVALGFAHRLDAADDDRFAGGAVDGGAVGALLDFLGIQPVVVGALVGFVVHHALGEQAGEGFLHRDVAGVLHRPGEEAGIQQVQDGVLDAADILVDRHPVIDRRLHQRDVGGRAAIAGEIPGAVDEGVERVGLPPRRGAAGRAGDMLPGRVVVERIAGTVEGDVVGQAHRQLVVRHRHHAAGVAMDDRDRAAPVALAGDAPVAQPPVGEALADALAFQPGDCGALGGIGVQAVEEAGVEGGAGACVGLIAEAEGGGVGARRQHDRGDAPGRICGRSPCRAGRGRGSRRWRRCRIPSGRNWRSRPGRWRLR